MHKSYYDPKYHDVSFQNIIKNKKLLEIFIKHLEKEQNSEALKFYFEVEDFLKITDFEILKSEFKKLYLKYFDSESRTELNVSARVREKML